MLKKTLCDCRQKAYPIIVINGYFSFGRFWEAMLEGASASWVALRLYWPSMKFPDWRRPGKGQWAVLYSWTRLWSSLDGLFVTQISCTFSGMVVTQPESTVLWTVINFFVGVVQKTMENVWEGFKNLAYSTVLCQSHTGTTVVDAFCS